MSGDGVTATITGEETTKPLKLPPRRGSGAPQKPKPWNNAQVATSLIRLSINIAPDAALGPRDLRLVTPAGLTPRWRFFVDQLPEVAITEPNGTLYTPTLLESLPIVANGQIYSGWESGTCFVEAGFTLASPLPFINLFYNGLNGFKSVVI